MRQFMMQDFNELNEILQELIVCLLQAGDVCPNRWLEPLLERTAKLKSKYAVVDQETEKQYDPEVIKVAVKLYGASQYTELDLSFLAQLSEKERKELISGDD